MQYRESAPSLVSTSNFYVDWHHQSANIVSDDNPPVFDGCNFGVSTDPEFTPNPTLAQAEQIADNDRFRFVAVRDPVFWRPLMEVQVGDQSYLDVTYFRVISKLADGNEVEVMNIFADGATRGKPEPLLGTSDSNLSSTVVIGPAQSVLLSTGEQRWAANVSLAQLFPDEGRVVLHYRDGGYADITLSQVDADTTRTFVDVNYNTDTSIAVFTSMNPGQDRNADTALVSYVDEEGSIQQQHIHEQQDVTGNNFLHWSNVENTHNPSGPFTEFVFQPSITSPPQYAKSEVHEVETLTGGPTRFQGNASEGITSPIFNGDGIDLPFELEQPAHVALVLRYSKGHSLPSSISASVNGTTRSTVATVDTGDGLPPFTGWNHFENAYLPLGNFSHGSHNARVTLSDVSVNGIEADTLSFVVFEHQFHPEVAFTPIGHLQGDTGSGVNGISADGATVVGYSESSSGSAAIVFDRAAESLAALPDLPGGQVGGFAQGVAGDGSVVVGTSQSSNSDFVGEGFVYTAGALVGLGDLPGGSFASQGLAVSDVGTVAGWSNIGLAYEWQAVTWNEQAEIQPLEFLNTADVTAAGNSISADGQVVAGFSGTLLQPMNHPGPATEATIWVDGEVDGKGDLAGGIVSSRFLDLDPSGMFAVGFGHTDLGYEATIWSEQWGMLGLGDLEGGQMFSEALAVSSARYGAPVVVGRSENERGSAAFIWNLSDGMRSLENVLHEDYGVQLAGWDLISATSISDDGSVIAGNGINPEGLEEGWVVELSRRKTPTLAIHQTRGSFGTFVVDSDAGDRAIFGFSSDVPLVGDVNGDGVDEVGVHRGINGLGYFFFDLNGNGWWDGSGIDWWAQYGYASDTPIIADLDGDGIDQIVVHRAANNGLGQFFSDTNENGKWDYLTDDVIQFGYDDDKPFAADLNGDGVDELGVRREGNNSLAQFYIDANNSGQWEGVSNGQDSAGQFGYFTDELIIGDWNGDGAEEIGVVRELAGNRHVYLDTDGNRIWSGIDAASDTYFNAGTFTGKLLAGNLDSRLTSLQSIVGVHVKRPSNLSADEDVAIQGLPLTVTTPRKVDTSHPVPEDSIEFGFQKTALSKEIASPNKERLVLQVQEAIGMSEDENDEKSKGVEDLLDVALIALLAESELRQQ